VVDDAGALTLLAPSAPGRRRIAGAARGRGVGEAAVNWADE